MTARVFDDISSVYTTARMCDVIDAMSATVIVAYDGPRPRILLHVGSDDGATDVDVEPTADEARRIAAALVSAAEAVERANR